MVAGIEELGAVQYGGSAVLGVTSVIPGAPTSLMLLGGGSGQVGAGLLQVVARAWRHGRWLRPSHAAGSPLAAESYAGGDSAGLRPHRVHGDPELDVVPPSFPLDRSQVLSTGGCCAAQDLPPSVDAFSDSDVLRENFLQIMVGCNLICGSRPCNFCMLTKDWTSICITQWFVADSPFTSSHFSIRLASIGSLLFLLIQAWFIIVGNENQRTIMNLIFLKICLEKMNCKVITQTSPRAIRCDALLIVETQGKYKESDKFNLGHIRLLLLHIDLSAANLEMDSDAKHEQDCICSSRCTKFFMSDDRPVEDTVPLFGFFHQRWTTTPLSLIPRFNSRGPSRLSSVMVLQDLQLSSLKPRMHTLDRPLGEPPTGHQLVWSMNEAL